MQLLVIFVLVGAVVAATADDDHHVEFHHDLNPRLFASAFRIRRLYRELEDLDHEIDEAAKIDPFGFIMEMHAKMDEIEGRRAPSSHLISSHLISYHPITSHPISSHLSGTLNWTGVLTLFSSVPMR